MNKKTMDSLMDSDLYKLIGVSNTASTTEIKKAYRKKALSCHPDKNPDNPRAAELFHELSGALEILTDASARVAYDKVINAKYQAKVRIQEFDAKRKKLKEDLEAREEAYRRSLNPEHTAKSDREKLQVEIERLQKEGSKQLEEEIAFMKRKLDLKSKRFCEEPETGGGSYKIKIKWKSSKDSCSSSDYNYDTLYRIFSKYGDVTGLVMSMRGDRALVEYRNKKDAETAANTEVGLAKNPLRLEKIWYTTHSSDSPGVGTAATGNGYNDRTSHVESQTKETHRKGMTDAEFELSVLRNLRKAEEIKRSSGRTNLEEGT